MFREHPEEMQYYHSIAKAGTLLLQIGEVGKQFNGSTSLSLSTSVESDGFLPSSVESASDLATRLQSGENGQERQNEELENSLKNLTLETSSREPVENKDDNACVEQSSDRDLASTLAPQKNVDNEETGSNSSSVNTPITVSVSQNSIASSKFDMQWSITCEHFIANILTEPQLVKFFEQQVDLSLSIEQFRNRRLMARQSSVSDVTKLEHK